MRLFLLYMFSHPGKKLTFMGTEFAQFKEWAYKDGLNFCLLEYAKHLKMHEYSKDLNWVYRGNDCLYEEDFSWDGFEWINVDTVNNVFAFIRKNTKGREMICVFNFSPLEIKDYKLGVKDEGNYELIFNTLEEKYGGVGVKDRVYQSIKESIHGKENCISIDLRGNEGLLIKLI